MTPEPSRVRKHADSTINASCPRSFRGAKKVASLPIALLLIALTLPACQSIHSDLQATAKNDILPPQDTVGGDV